MDMLISNGTKVRSYSEDHSNNNSEMIKRVRSLSDYPASDNTVLRGLMSSKLNDDQSIEAKDHVVFLSAKEKNNEMVDFLFEDRKGSLDFFRSLDFYSIKYQTEETVNELMDKLPKNEITIDQFGEFAQIIYNSSKMDENDFNRCKELVIYCLEKNRRATLLKSGAIGEAMVCMLRSSYSVAAISLGGAIGGLAGYAGGKFIGVTALTVGPYIPAIKSLAKGDVQGALAKGAGGFAFTSSIAYFLGAGSFVALAPYLAAALAITGATGGAYLAAKVMGKIYYELEAPTQIMLAGDGNK